MASENVPNGGNAFIRNEKSIIFTNVISQEMGRLWATSARANVLARLGTFEARLGTYLGQLSKKDFHGAAGRHFNQPMASD